MTTPNTDWLDSFIEQWIPIERKDPDYIKQAKVTARKEFIAKVVQHEQQARIDELRKVTVQEVDSNITDWSAYYYIQDRIATLTQQTSQGVSDDR